jgi:hypothetical protein
MLSKVLPVTTVNTVSIQKLQGVDPVTYSKAPPGAFLFTKYCMGQFVQILLLVTVVYLTLILSVKTMFGDYTNLFAIMTAMLLTCMVVLTVSMS